MKITKFVHACLLVEMPAPTNRTALFDPGVYSADALDIDSLEFLDNIIISHAHPDHFSIDLVKRLVSKFPDVRITSTPEVVAHLAEAGMAAVSEETPGIEFFDAPHAPVAPLTPQPQEIGVHYLGLLSFPGDSHTFTESKQVLALPVTAPWGTLVRALQLAIDLKPKYVLPIHDWFWRDEARQQNYDNIAKILKEQGIEFLKLETGKPVVLQV